MKEAIQALSMDKHSSASLQPKMAIIGAGVLGTATALVFAKIARMRISVFDISSQQEENSSRILQREMGEKEIADGFTFCPALSEAVQNSTYVAVCVPTPSSTEPDESYDYAAINNVMQQLHEKVSGDTTILVRSTVDPAWLREKSGEFHERVWYLPAFFREKTYINESIDPENIIVGLPNSNPSTIHQARNLFSAFNCPKHFTTLESAALAKFFVNAFMATKISFFNEVGRAALKCGEDPQEVADLVALDGRIGSYGSRPGSPYGGKCLPKDVDAVLKLFDMKVVSASKLENEEMRKRRPSRKLIDDRSFGK